MEAVTNNDNNDASGSSSSSSTLEKFQRSGIKPQYIEGNKSVKSYTFGYGVESVEVLLTSHLRNMKGELCTPFFFYCMPCILFFV